jgi:hypothetical protein
MFTIRPHRLRAVEGAGQVHPQVPLPELRHLVGKLADVVERAGVVDEDVDRAELVDDTLHGLLDLSPVGHVALDRGRAAPQRRDLLRGGLGVDEALGPRRLREGPVFPRLFTRVGLDLDVRDDDVGAGARKRQRVGSTEAPRAAGHEGDAPREVNLDAQSRGIRSSRAITSRWIWDVPS